MRAYARWSAGLAAGLLGAFSAPALAQSDVLAQGQFAQLTLDNANAFLEAAVFCHHQVGAPIQTSAQELQAYRRMLAQSFPMLSPQQQVTLGQARSVWHQYYGAWPGLGVSDKQEFCFGVLEIAYGTAAAQAAVYGAPQSGPRSGAGTGRMPSAPDFEGFDPDTGTYATPFGSHE